MEKVFEVRMEKTVFFGGNQNWYEDKWRQMSGCGPTAASNIVWYFARSRKELSCLYPIDTGSRQECLQLMNDMFSFVKPGIGGVKNPRVFAKGMTHYAETKGIAAVSEILRIPIRPFRRPDYEKVERFIMKSLQSDLPVAFLNYSNGTLPNLGSWHWVTIVNYKPEERLTVISDQGFRKEISMFQWLETSFAGGALVSVNMW